MSIYDTLSRLFPTRPAPENPRRIVLIQPCCIGDVLLATAALAALRRAYPGAHLTWAVGSWSKGVVELHPMVDAVLDTGAEALPVYSPRSLWRFARDLRAGRFDLAVSLVRSPLMSAAVLLAGIPYRAGLDSAGRGFGYNLRAPIDPHTPRHEADIYLDVARALGLDVTGCRANLPPRQADRAAVRALLDEQGVGAPYIVLSPVGGRNPGMVLDAKRWPPHHLAALADRLAARLAAQVVLVGGPDDDLLLAAVAENMQTPSLRLAGKLTFGQIAALAADARLYVGNDTGLTHLAAAAGAPTVMILGPSDPARYAPFADNAVALWKPSPVSRTGVAGGAPKDWDWMRDGIGVDEAEARILAFLADAAPQM
ncbi:MAG: glycosyltransferase family 9 protein [Chloroflexi bacterium]|nr:glycosyltransferase family 9 protein [Chloroflexota bacterium]